ncbi:alpha/beta fold hydrolase [Mangrovicoccus ximenensis]|uniref:alpha/beta fold hydrolase n=1 Tax=Mangrovicoccus ximenensis TaxID=1911570 RepID=UPI000D37B7F6|nr:alpha/beta hydrolase [Mangrovicoccus ximenensis]
MQQEDAARRWNATIAGGTDRSGTVVFAHGFGCDQHIWKDVAPAFAGRWRVVLFDHAGCGQADRTLYDRHRHARLDGYAEDLVSLLQALALGPVHLVAHSVSSMIGALASIRQPELFRQLVMIGPSACYLNKEGYDGGFEREAVEELLSCLEANFVGWANSFAPLATGQPIEAEVTRGFSRTLSRNDPEIASIFARTTMMSDCRAILGEVPVPVHVVQTRDDLISPEAAVRHVHENLPQSTLHRMQATGHCPHVTHPAELVALLADILGPAEASGRPEVTGTGG